MVDVQLAAVAEAEAVWHQLTEGMRTALATLSRAALATIDARHEADRGAP